MYDIGYFQCEKFKFQDLKLEVENLQLSLNENEDKVKSMEKIVVMKDQVWKLF